jgi:hypothetical protein
MNDRERTSRHAVIQVHLFLFGIGRVVIVGAVIGAFSDHVDLHLPGWDEADLSTSHRNSFSSQAQGWRQASDIAIVERAKENARRLQQQARKRKSLARNNKTWMRLFR